MCTQSHVHIYRHTHKHLFTVLRIRLRTVCLIGMHYSSELPCLAAP